MKEIIEILMLIVGVLILFSLHNDNKKLERRIEANEDYIKDLYRIDDERLLKK